MGEFAVVEKYVGRLFHDTDASENYEILGDKCLWRLQHGWYVRVRAQDAGEDEEPETYAINSSLWGMTIASSHLNPTRTILPQAVTRVTVLAKKFNLGSSRTSTTPRVAP